MEPLKITCGPNFDNRKKTFRVNREISFGSDTFCHWISWSNQYEIERLRALGACGSYIVDEALQLKEVDCVFIRKRKYGDDSVEVRLKHPFSWDYNLKERIKEIINTAVSNYPSKPRELTPEALPASSDLN